MQLEIAINEQKYMSTLECVSQSHDLTPTRSRHRASTRRATLHERLERTRAGDYATRMPVCDGLLMCVAL